MPAIWDLVRIEGNVIIPIQPGAPRPPDKFLAVLIPHTGEVIMEWALNLKNIQFPPGTQIFMSRGLPIDVTRDQLTESVLKLGFEWIFYLDSDVILPPDAVMKMLSLNLPLVSGVYDAKKREGFYPAAWVGVTTKAPDGTEKQSFAPVAQFAGRLVAVDVVGAGCLLVHKTVFQKIREKTKLPFFLWTKERRQETIDAMQYPDPRMKEVSEDFFFCLLAKAHAGVQIVVDTSVHCGHIATLKIEHEKVTIPAV